MPKRIVLIATGSAVATIVGFWVIQTTSAPTLLASDSSAVAQTESARRVPGSQIRDVTLTAAPAKIDLGGGEVKTWAFNGRTPGPTTIRDPTAAATPRVRAAVSFHSSAIGVAPSASVNNTRRLWPACADVA